MLLKLGSAFLARPSRAAFIRRVAFRACRAGMVLQPVKHPNRHPCRRIPFTLKGEAVHTLRVAHLVALTQAWTVRFKMDPAADSDSKTGGFPWQAIIFGVSRS